MLNFENQKSVANALTPFQFGSKSSKLRKFKLEKTFTHFLIVPHLKISPNGPPGLNPADRDAQRKYVRDVLGQSYC